MRHSSYLEVNLGLLAENFSAIKDLAPKAAILPMVKADAYGNGLIPISQFLVNDCQVKSLGCASLGEALRLKEECPGLGAELVVFSDTELANPKARKAYLDSRIYPVIHQKSDLEVVLKDKTFFDLPLIIKVNTGMNRLGLSEEDLGPYLPLLKQRGIYHFMTHFARSGEVLKPGDKTNRQYDEFLRLKKMLQDTGIRIEKTSVSNSGAIEQRFGTDESYVRPGLMLYGPASVLGPVRWQGHQVSRWVTTVLSSFLVKKGTPVGYGVNVADKDSFMTVLPIGYGDGFFTYYSGSTVTINGIPGKVFGRVNMDMTFIQFDPDAANFIKNGDQVEIWDHQNRRILEFASQNGTHCYQVMCGISSRIPRIYKVK